MYKFVDYLYMIRGSCKLFQQDKIVHGVAQTATESILQIKEINRLFFAAQEKIKKEAGKAYDKELLELLFEQPYSKIDHEIGISNSAARPREQSDLATTRGAGKEDRGSYRIFRKIKTAWPTILPTPL